jgi:hypothetical protein
MRPNFLLRLTDYGENLWYVDNLIMIFDLVLTSYREWIQTAYSGNVMRRLYLSAKTLPAGLKDVLQQPIDHRHISQKMV